jgi:hypothetical protein
VSGRTFIVRIQGIDPISYKMKKRQNEKKKKKSRKRVAYYNVYSVKLVIIVKIAIKIHAKKGGWGGGRRSRKNGTKYSY